MIDIKQINQWVQDIIDTLPPGLKNISEDTQAHLRATLQQTFTNLDLVTHEEFDTQSKVLEKTRAKLEELELRIAKLESTKKFDPTKTITK